MYLCEGLRGEEWQDLPAHIQRSTASVSGQHTAIYLSIIQTEKGKWVSCKHDRAEKSSGLSCHEYQRQHGENPRLRGSYVRTVGPLANGALPCSRW
jgi:hypothetical protein